jgi:hypothetical protein
LAITHDNDLSSMTDEELRESLQSLMAEICPARMPISSSNAHLTPLVGLDEEIASYSGAGSGRPGRDAQAFHLERPTQFRARAA